MATRDQLRTRLTNAQRSGDPVRIRQAETLLIAHLSTLDPDIHRFFAQQTRALIGEIFQADRITARTVRRAIDRTAKNLRTRYRQKLELIGQEILRIVRDNSRLLWMPWHRRAGTSLPIDRHGLVMPRPGVPEALGDFLTESEVLAAISVLVVIAGDLSDRRLQDQLDVELVGPADRRRDVVGLINSATPSVSRPWPDKLRAMRQLVARKSRPLAERAEQDPAAARKMFRAEMDKWQRLVDLESRHEAQRMLGRQRQRIAERNPSNIGYVLHSVFAPNARFPDSQTRATHANRDGWRFYRDNRPGSALPWRRRLIPPYEKNCLCFTVEIMEDPQGAEFFAEWDAWPRISGGRLVRQSDVGGVIYDDKRRAMRLITSDDVGNVIGSRGARIQPRDVGIYEKWFDSMPPNVQKIVMGEPRWFAAATRSQTGKVLYRDFVRTGGEVMSPTDILGEPNVPRRARREVVRQLIDRSHKRHQQAWEQTGNKWALEQYREAEYRQRLDRFLSTMSST